MKFDWWTFLLQTINVAVLIWILQRFLFKPIQTLIMQRQQAIQQSTDAAIAAKQQAEQEQQIKMQELQQQEQLEQDKLELEYQKLEDENMPEFSLIKYAE